ncbi:Nitric oxide synthase, brain, partial [Fragariocoptes setiger]
MTSDNSTCNNVSVLLKNLNTGDTQTDTLHARAPCAPVGCTALACLGSIVECPLSNLISSAPKLDEREQIWQHAVQFFDQYYASIKRAGSAAHTERMREIRAQLGAQQTYQLKEQELIYGAKLAWRNASRCIGRIQWSKLQVFDARDSRTAADMFEAVCNHIKYGTNRGMLRSTITIFPQRIGRQRSAQDYRIWNSQLISYAGYCDARTNHQTLGDPLNLELTQICEQLGWQPPNEGALPGQFDILPLVVSACGEPPELFELPAELILRVKLEHPRCAKFAALKLEWYALPAVSAMLLDIGGLQFPACPFNGWYMVTEVGTRDLADTRRYNCLAQVAACVCPHLDQHTNTSLWRDVALAELNCAVLWSFQRSGVTMVDHHTAAETFMTHFANEFRLRGGCPADWVWIVPPTSGSQTPVYHQEMLNYHLLPAYEYQTPAWREAHFKRQLAIAIATQQHKSSLAAATSIPTTISTSGIAHNGNSEAAVDGELTNEVRVGDGVFPMQMTTPDVGALKGDLQHLSTPMTPPSGTLASSGATPRRLRRFKEVARAVKFTSKLFGKALARRVKATILYASETGKSERYAHKLAQIFSHAFNVHVTCMADYDMSACLEHEALLLVVTSTFGNGDPPENGDVFARQLHAIKLTGDATPDSRTVNHMVSTTTFCRSFSTSVASSLANLDSSGGGLDSASFDQTQEGVIAATADNATDNASDSLNQQVLANVRFAVFALGSSAYPNFCAFGRYVDATLAHLGAERLVECACGDELCGQERAFAEWSRCVFARACDVFCVTDNADALSTALSDARASSVSCWRDVRLVYQPLIQPPTQQSQQHTLKCSTRDSEAHTRVAQMARATNKRIVEFRLVERVDLHPIVAESDHRQLTRDEIGDDQDNNKDVEFQRRQTIRVELATRALGAHEPGDHVAIYPTNDEQLVAALAKRCTSRQLGAAFDVHALYRIYVYNESDDIFNESTTATTTPNATTNNNNHHHHATNNNQMSSDSQAMNGDEWVPHERLPQAPVSVYELLRRYVDVTSAPTQELLATLARCFAHSAHDQRRLQELAQSARRYELWRTRQAPTFLDVLNEFSSVEFDVSLLTQMPMVQPRFYSISSFHNNTHSNLTLNASPNANKCDKLSTSKTKNNSSNSNTYAQISLTVAVVRYVTSGSARRRGLCSNYLAYTLSPGDALYGFTRSAPAFHMPPSASTPMVLIGPGTGVAPFRSFWQHRHQALIRSLSSQYYYHHNHSNPHSRSRSRSHSQSHNNCATATNNVSACDDGDGLCDDAGNDVNGGEHFAQTFGPIVLFMGCRVPLLELYKDEVDDMKALGVINVKRVAYSRVTDAPKRHVQDCMRDEAQLISELVLEHGAHVYVCGDVDMAEGVSRTFTQILASLPNPQHGILMQLRERGRYHEDIFGAKPAS